MTKCCLAIVDTPTYAYFMLIHCSSFVQHAMLLIYIMFKSVRGNKQAMRVIRFLLKDTMGAVGVRTHD